MEHRWIHVGYIDFKVPLYNVKLKILQKDMKKFFFLMLLLFVAFMPQVFAQSPKTPEDVVVKYYTFLKKDKYEEAANLAVFQYGNWKMEKTEYVEALRVLLGREFKKKGGLSSVKVVKVEEGSGGKKHVTCQLTMGNGKQENEITKVVKVDNQWKILPF